MIETPLSEHFSALRGALIKIILFIAIGTCLGFFLSDKIITLLSAETTQKYKSPPAEQLLVIKKFSNHKSETLILSFREKWEIVSGQNFKIYEDTIKIEPSGHVNVLMVPSERLVLFSPSEGFKIALKVAFYSGVLLSFPFWIFPLFSFILPALTKKEKKMVIPLIVFSLVAAVSGMIVAHSYTIPATNQYFMTFNQSLGENLWGLDAYLDYVFALFIAHALGFEIAIGMFFLIHYGYISGQQMRKHRKTSILGAFIIGALLTPPDIPSQLIFAGLMIAFYELGVFYATACYKYERGRSYRVDPATLSTR